MPQQIMPLSTASEHSWVYIDNIQAIGHEQAKLFGMGLAAGSQLTILRNRKGDIVLGNGHNRISLGKAISEKIFVKKQLQ